MPSPVTVARTTASKGKIFNDMMDRVRLDVTEQLASWIENEGVMVASNDRDRVIGSNTCNRESCCRSSGSCCESRGFDKFSHKRTCWSLARSAKGESGGRPSAVASAVRLNWTRAVNWSLSARRMKSNTGSFARFHSFRYRDRRARAGVVGPRVRPSGSFFGPKAATSNAGGSVLRDTQVLNCIRVCRTDRKG